ncbi:MAG TPA: four helix bundle protein [Caulifigura sp.]|jgi:four helix bundle protein|nr:four helix bundle protein [Caulifigura sp.]
MAGVRVFTELRMWTAAREWARRIYPLTQRGAFKGDFRLVGQINDSAASVMANIAEGFGRGTQGEFVTFLGYSIGSLNETQSHLTVAFDRQYVDKSEYSQLFREGTEVRKQIVAFIRSLVRPGTGVKNLRPVKSWSDQVWELYERTTGQERPVEFRSNSESSPPRIVDQIPD